MRIDAGLGQSRACLTLSSPRRALWRCLGSVVWCVGCDHDGDECHDERFEREQHDGDGAALRHLVGIKGILLGVKQQEGSIPGQ